jgi:hypothetical protein
VHEGRVLRPGQELELPELHRLEAAGRGQRLAELQEVLRGHRLQDVELVQEDPLHDVHPRQQVLRPPQPLGVPVEHRVACGAGLVQQLLEPQLVDLVDGDEQQLVVRAGLEPLRRQQLREREVGAVGQPRPVLAERDVGAGRAAARAGVVCHTRRVTAGVG